MEENLEELGFSSIEVRPTSLEDVVLALNMISNTESDTIVTMKEKPSKGWDFIQIEEEKRPEHLYNFGIKNQVSNN